MKIDYGQLDTIRVGTQSELNGIPHDFKGVIYIDSIASRPLTVKVRYPNPVIVKAGHVKAINDSNIVAKEYSRVEAYDNATVEAHDNAKIYAYDTASVKSYDYSQVNTHQNSRLEAHDGSFVGAWDNSSVKAYDKTDLEAYGNSRIEAYDNTPIKAYANSRIEAYGNSRIEAYDNSTITAHHNCQILDVNCQGKIKLFDDVRIAHMLKTVEEFCSFYGIDTIERTAKLYMCVHKDGGRYFSNKSKAVEYFVGQSVYADIPNDSTLNKAFHLIPVSCLSLSRENTSSWTNSAILEVKVSFENASLSRYDTGTLLCKEVFIIREVPFEEHSLQKSLTRYKPEYKTLGGKS